MKINHHLDDATILAFAAGTLGEAHGYVAATHMALCPACQAAKHRAEAVGGQLLAQQDEVAVSNTCRSATLASLDAIKPQSVAPRAALQVGVPAVLCNALGNVALDDLKWRSKGPGISAFEVPLTNRGKTHLQLLRIAPGRKLPEHGHGGEEITVVLRGSYKDHTGSYAAGDVADLDEDTEHQPLVDSDVDCVCLVATEAPTRFKSIWARLAQPFIGI